MSPSFENAIVLWRLEKINRRLPAKAKKDYGYKMTRNVTLKDIQSVVLENTANMLEELDTAKLTKALASSANIIETNQDVHFNALSERNNFCG